MAGLLVFEKIGYRLILLVYLGVEIALIVHLHVFRIVFDVARYLIRVVLLVVVVVGTLGIDGHAGFAFGQVRFQYLGQRQLPAGRGNYRSTGS